MSRGDMVSLMLDKTTGAKVGEAKQVRRLLYYFREEMTAAWTRMVQMEAETWLDSKYVFKVEPTRFPEGLDGVCGHCIHSNQGDLLGF